MSKPKAVVDGNIGPDDDVIPIIYRLRLEAEIIHVLTFSNVSPRVMHPAGEPLSILPPGEPIASAFVRRGQEGTTAVSHAAGTEIEWLDPA